MKDDILEHFQWCWLKVVGEIGPARRYVKFVKPVRHFVSMVLTILVGYIIKLVCYEYLVVINRIYHLNIVINDTDCLQVCRGFHKYKQHRRLTIFIDKGSDALELVFFYTFSIFLFMIYIYDF